MACSAWLIWASDLNQCFEHAGIIVKYPISVFSIYDLNLSILYFTCLFYITYDHVSLWNCSVGIFGPEDIQIRDISCRHRYFWCLRLIYLLGRRFHYLFIKFKLGFLCIFLSIWFLCPDYTQDNWSKSADLCNLFSVELTDIIIHFRSKSWTSIPKCFFLVYKLFKWIS